MSFLCPRRRELGDASVFKLPQTDEWQDYNGARTCSRCGSIHPEDLFLAIETGCKLGPTDKSYKLYVDIPHPLRGQEIEIGSFTQNGSRTPIMGVANYAHHKFYFMHLSHEEKQRFTDIYNYHLKHRVLNFGYPGYFYSPPYFWVRQDKDA